MKFPVTVRRTLPNPRRFAVKSALTAIDDSVSIKVECLTQSNDQKLERCSGKEVEKPRPSLTLKCSRCV